MWTFIPLLSACVPAASNLLLCHVPACQRGEMGISSLLLEMASLGCAWSPTFGWEVALLLLGNAALVLWLVFQEDAL